MENRLRVLALTFLFSFSIQAAVKTANLGKTLRFHKKELASITKQIFSIESNLGKGNKRYLNTLNKRKKIEAVIVKLEISLKNEQRLTEAKKTSTKKRLRQVLVQSLGKAKTPAQLLGRNIVTKMLKKEIAELNRIQKSSSSLLTRLATTQKQYQQLRQVESDLLSLMNEMEDSKKAKSERYVVLKKKKDLLQGKMKLKKAKKYVKKKKKARPVIAERFSPPINNISDMEYGKKGVTYKFNTQQWVKTSRKGKVIHTGSLSTYGNVVIVEHGNEVKSIYLGQFLPTVKKGQSVLPGESLGKTFDVAKNEGKLYFEVRKKNKAQNTILLLDKNSATVDNKRQQRI